MSYAWITPTREVMTLTWRGRVLTCSAICPHMGARLVPDMRKGVVVCPWHGLIFRLPGGEGVHPRYDTLAVREGPPAPP